MISLSYNKNKEFYKNVVQIGLPVALQNLVSSSLNLVDNIMIGSLGTVAIASTGVANQYTFLSILMLFGINSGMGIFTAQYYGSKDLSNIKRVVTLGLLISVLFTGIFFLIAAFIPEMAISVFSPDTEVIKHGASYLRIISVLFLLNTITNTLSMATRSVRKPSLAMYSAIISLLINTFLNYVLIFGNFGFPALGIEGAAIATVIAKVIDTLIMVIGVRYLVPEVNFSISSLKGTTREFLKKLASKVLPVLLNEGFWSLGMSATTLIYARMSTNSVAATTIAFTIMQIVNAFAFGVSSAGGVMLGNSLGAGKLTEANDTNKQLLALVSIMGVFFGGVLALLSYPIVQGMYNLDPITESLTIYTILVIAIFLPSKFYNTLMIIGTLRSGGDTFYSMFLEAGCVWLIHVPLAFLGGLVFELPIHWVMLLQNMEEVVKMGIGTIRVRSGKWIKTLV